MNSEMEEEQDEETEINDKTAEYMLSLLVSFTYFSWKKNQSIESMADNNETDIQTVIQYCNISLLIVNILVKYFQFWFQLNSIMSTSMNITYEMG